MRRYAPWIMLFCIALLLLLPAGCGTSQASRFYTLNPVTTGPAFPPSSGPAASIAIQSVEIPDYLDRPEIVTRNGNNGLELAEFDRWAGELQKDIARVLAETMSARLPENNVFVLTGRRVAPADYTITVHVTRFDPVPGNAVRLKAMWTIMGKDGSHLVARGESSLSEPIQGQNYGAIVAAMSRAVDQLGKELVGAMKPML
ncbi:MAG: PqiC family protein, partial [Syntrophorhabdales bacterium]